MRTHHDNLVKSLPNPRLLPYLSPLFTFVQFQPFRAQSNCQLLPSVSLLAASEARFPSPNSPRLNDLQQLCCHASLFKNPKREAPFKPSHSHTLAPSPCLLFPVPSPALPTGSHGKRSVHSTSHYPPKTYNDTPTGASHSKTKKGSADPGFPPSQIFLCSLGCLLFQFAFCIAVRRTALICRYDCHHN
jgi:hypothetical protein